MTSASAHRPTPAVSIAEDRLAWGPVHLDVTDVDRSLTFWRDAVGLEQLGSVRSADDGGTVLGAGDEPLLVLRDGATRPAQRGHSGLYHVALHVPDERAFAATIDRIARAAVAQAPTDHVMHWATYATDPDGLGLEISFETLDRFDHYELDGGRGPVVVSTDGRRLPGVGHLDLEQVMSHAPRGGDPRIAPGTRVGHVHLHVGDVAAAARHYRDAFGFEVATELPGFGMVDFHAGGSFPHRLALNAWQGEGVPPAPDGTARLRAAELTVRDADRRAELLGEHRDGRVVDPSGNAVLVR